MKLGSLVCYAIIPETRIFFDFFFSILAIIAFSEIAGETSMAEFRETNADKRETEIECVPPAEK